MNDAANGPTNEPGHLTSLQSAPLAFEQAAVYRCGPDGVRRWIRFDSPQNGIIAEILEETIKTGSYTRLSELGADDGQGSA